MFACILNLSSFLTHFLVLHKSFTSISSSPVPPSVTDLLPTSFSQYRIHPSSLAYIDSHSPFRRARHLLAVRSVICHCTFSPLDLPVRVSVMYLCQRPLVALYENKNYKSNSNKNKSYSKNDEKKKKNENKTRIKTNISWLVPDPRLRRFIFPFSDINALVKCLVSILHLGIPIPGVIPSDLIVSDPPSQCICLRVLDLRSCGKEFTPFSFSCTAFRFHSLLIFFTSLFFPLCPLYFITIWLSLVLPFCIALQYLPITLCAFCS